MAFILEDIFEFICNKLKYHCIVLLNSAKPVLGLVISLDLGVLSGLFLCLHKHLGSALMKKICLAFTKDISGDF